MKHLKDKIDTHSILDDSNTQQSFAEELESILGFSDAFERLWSELSEFEKRLKTGFSKNEFIDIELARKLYVISSALFRICQKEPYAEHVPFALAAISYFVRADDGQDDFQDINGFEDDEKVLQMVINQFKLEDAVEREVLEMQKNKEQESA